MIWTKYQFYWQKIKHYLQEWENERLLLERFPTAKIEKDVQIKNPHLLTLGENVIFQKGTILHCGGMTWSDGKGSVQVGDNVGISPYCVLYGAGGIVIGDRSTFGPCCMIFSQFGDYSTSTVHPVKHQFREVRIGKEVWMFAGCIVNPGVTIGDGAVIQAGSMVTKDIPPKAICRGVPARQVGERP